MNIMLQTAVSSLNFQDRVVAIGGEALPSVGDASFQEVGKWENLDVYGTSMGRLWDVSGY